MQIKLLVVLILIQALEGSRYSSSRVRVLRTPEEKMRFLNYSRVAKENFFFGLRPILYVSRYSCNCPEEATVPGSSAPLDLPEFPSVEDSEVIPPSDSFMPGSPSSSEASPHPFPSKDKSEFLS